MEPYQLHHGDCLEVMASMADNSVDAVVTDPPYGLSFMGKNWDHGVPGEAFWREALRVAKPGAHLLAFGGTRTYHRLTCAIEDAGWEIRDCVMWVYGCLDEQTEVATIDGVKPYHKTMVGDLVLCYNPETGEYSYQPILEIVEYEYSDTVYRLVGDFGEQVVSKNHRCIVEQGGKEVFQLAETLEQQACVPVLEDLPALQQALRNAHQGASGQKQDLWQEVCSGIGWQGQQRPYVNRTAQANSGGVQCLRHQSTQARFMAETHRSADVQPTMQRQAQREGMGAARSQGPQQLASGIRAGVGRADDRGEQSSMERWSHLSQSERGLRKSVDQVCAVSSRVYSDGPKRWLCNGAPIDSSSSHWQAIDSNRMRSPHQPRCNGQQDSKSNVVHDECGAQGVRTWQGHKTSVVRVVPFHYTGKVWCLRVPTGAFVAVRNGVAFPTGNSGFPKSLDVSKAIDKAAGAEREVVGIHRRHGGGSAVSGSMAGPLSTASELPLTAPATDAARTWQGWGTALKPAWEPVIVARKPLEGTVAANVLKYGTGAINVDGCRVNPGENVPGGGGGKRSARSSGILGEARPGNLTEAHTAGRWPANLILTYPEDEYMLRDDVTPDQLHKLAEWMNENAER